MKKQHREVYQILANEVDFALCSFCKYGWSTGSPCDCIEIECHHPLGQVLESEAEKALNLGDCWGFRPGHPISFIADIVGTVLANGWTSASWWLNRKGIWKVTGTNW